MNTTRWGSFLCVFLATLFSGCEADLGSNTTPLTAEEESSVAVFGAYDGVYQEGSAGEERLISLEASDCGKVITGIMTGLFDEEISLQGALVGNALYVEGSSEAEGGYTLVLTGFVPSGSAEEAAPYISGFWEGAGESGTWIVEWDEEASGDAVCDSTPDPEE